MAEGSSPSRGSAPPSRLPTGAIVVAILLAFAGASQAPGVSSASGPLAFSSASTLFPKPRESRLGSDRASPPALSHREPAGADVMSAFAPESAGAVAAAGPPVADRASLGGKVHISFCQS
jgi:hypothetical protein